MTIRTSRFWGLSHSLKAALCHSNVGICCHQQENVETIVHEVGDVALGNANVDSKKPFWEVEANEGRCALPRSQWSRLNLVMALSILTWNVI